MLFASHKRSYDSRRQAVRFWGYDGAVECAFFVTAEALRRVHPAMLDSEAGLLEAFDSNRELICAMAARLHAWERGRRYGPAVAEI